MAIMMLDKLQEKESRDNKAATDKRNALIERFEELRERIYEYADTCRDLVDTYNYLNKSAREFVSKPRGGIYNDMYDTIAFEQRRWDANCPYSLIYLKYIDYQRISYTSGEFIVEAVGKFNGCKCNEMLKDINANLKNSYFLEECISMMEGYIKTLPEFYSKFTEKLGTLVNK